MRAKWSMLFGPEGSIILWPKGSILFGQRGQICLAFPRCLDLASARIVMAFGIIGRLNETPVNQIYYHILPHLTFLL